MATGASLDDVRLEEGLLEEHLATTFEEGKSLVAKSLDEIAPVATTGAVLLALSVTPPKSRAVRINECGLVAGARQCWCFTSKVPEEVLDRVPPEARGVACVCCYCATGQPPRIR